MGQGNRSAHTGMGSGVEGRGEQGASPSGSGSRKSSPAVSPAAAASIPRAKSKPSPEYLIAEYMVAYRAANGKQPDFRIVHVAGWAQFRSWHSSAILDRKRIGYLVTMTKRLRDRAAARVSDEHPQGENASAVEGEACQRGGKAETPSQSPDPLSQTVAPSPAPRGEETV